MKNGKKDRLAVYLLWAFGVAWILQIAAGMLFRAGKSLAYSALLAAAVNPLVGRLLENAYWFYSYRYTIIPVLLIVPVFALLGYAIPAVMYRQEAKQSVVERLREVEV